MAEGRGHSGTNWEPTAVMVMVNGNDDNSRDDMKRLYSGYILKLEPRVFAGGIDVVL